MKKSGAAPLLLALGFFLAIIVTRLPLLGNGFGSDVDSWRNATGALHMHELGRYAPSRPPGFPVFELLLLPLVPLGPAACNLMTAVAGALAALGFFSVAKKLRIRHSFWTAFALAFSGVLWVHTTQTIDYALGLAFLIGCYRALLDRRYITAGVLLALSAGCRLTNGAMVVPALAMLLVRGDERRVVVKFIAGFLVSSLVVLIPVIATFDPGQLGQGLLTHASKAHVTAARLWVVLRSSAVFLFGKLGTAALVLGLLWSTVLAARRHRLSQLMPSTSSLPETQRTTFAPVVFELGVVLVVVGFYLMIPYDAAYLTPLLPFTLLLVARVLTRRWFITVALLMASEVAVMPLFDQKRVVMGRLFQEVAQRKADLAASRALAARNPDEPTIFVVGRFNTLRLLVLNPSLERTEAGWAAHHGSGVGLWTTDRRIGYAEYLDPRERTALADEGYQVEDVNG